MPKYSIIMPVYKVPEYIHNSIASVLRQTNQDYELILVDDGSPDQCPQICDEYASKNSQISVIHQENMGLSGARNSGEKVATGEYIYFLDSDDMIQSDALSDFDAILSEAKDVNFIFTDYQRVALGDEFHTAGYNRGYEVIDDRKSIQEGYMIGRRHILAPGTLYNRKWYQSNGLYFRNNPFGEDQLFIYYELLCVDKCVYFKKPVYNYLYRPGSIMTGSSYNKVAASYPFMKEVNARYQSDETASPVVKKYLLPRWCFGVTHSVSKLCGYKEFYEFTRIVDADSLIPRLKGFPSFYVRAFSRLYKLSPRLYYRMFRILDSLTSENQQNSIKRIMENLKKIPKTSGGGYLVDAQYVAFNVRAFEYKIGMCA